MAQLTTEVPSFLQQETAATQSQSRATAKMETIEGSISALVDFACYVKADKSGKSIVNKTYYNCPDTEYIKGDNGSFAGKLKIHAYVVNLTELPGRCEKQPDGSWLITSSVGYDKKNGNLDPKAEIERLHIQSTKATDPTPPVPSPVVDITTVANPAAVPPAQATTEDGAIPMDIDPADNAAAAPTVPAVVPVETSTHKLIDDDEAEQEDSEVNTYVNWKDYIVEKPVGPSKVHAFAQNRKIRIYPGSKLSFKVPDKELSSIFRKKISGSDSAYEVHEGVPLLLSQLDFNDFVAMRQKIDKKNKQQQAGQQQQQQQQPQQQQQNSGASDAAVAPTNNGDQNAKKPKKDVFYLTSSITVTAKKVELATMGKHMSRIDRIKERYNFNQHMLAPLFDLNALTTDPRIPRKGFYFHVKHNYSTPYANPGTPAYNPDLEGVSMIVEAPSSWEAPDDDNDFMGTFKQGLEPKMIKRLAFFQWKGSPNDMSKLERYKLLFQAWSKDIPMVIRNFGIEMGERDFTIKGVTYRENGLKMYARIMEVHFDLDMYIYASISPKGTRQLDANRPEALAKENDKDNEKGNKVLGWYKLSIHTVVPDFETYFRDGKALQISRKLTWKIFELFSKTHDDEQILLMPGASTPNAVNAAGHFSPVLALGSRNFPQYKGDITDILAKGSVYVLSAYRLDAETRRTMCGPNADLALSDALMLKIMEQNIPYQIYLVQGKEGDEPTPPLSKKARAE